MRASDKPRFKDLLTDAWAFYRRDMSTFALDVWWQACNGFDYEQVASALTAHAMDPERGQFAPMPADIVKKLHGTQTDRSLIAWGNTLDAMQRVGAYSSVCFDDGVIHAVIEDMGGWVKLCRSNLDELPHLQRRFCDSYRAYANRGGVAYPALLAGAHALENRLKGHASAPPTLIGDPAKAKRTLELGNDMPKTRITHVTESLVDMRMVGDAA
jgi:hypothetical protein